MPLPGGFAFDRSNYTRYIEVVDSDASTHVITVSNAATSTNFAVKMEFELLRQGGCGAGSLVLSRSFPYEVLDIGMYVRCRYRSDSENVYLGRITEINEESPAGVTLRLEGPMSLLNDVQIGGFDSEDLRLPHLYAASDFWVYDPDKNIQSWEFVDTIPGLIQKLYDQYIDPKTNITLGSIGPFSNPIAWGTGIFRGQENISQVIRTLAVQQLGACYGVDANNQFFFIPRVADLPGNELATYKEGTHLTSLKKTRDMSMIYNRLIIHGDYVYNLISGYKMYRFARAYTDAASVAQYGAKKITLYVPWIRSNMDAQSFADGFFDIWGNATTRYEAVTKPQGDIIKPWEGLIGLQRPDGTDYERRCYFDRIKVNFDEAPTIEFTTGPEDLQFPVAPDPQRWELAPTGQEAFPEFPDLGSSSGHGGSTGGGSSGGGSTGGSSSHGGSTGGSSHGSSFGSEDLTPARAAWVRITDNGGAKNVTAAGVFVSFPFVPAVAGVPVVQDGTGDAVIVGNPRNNWLEEDEIYLAHKVGSLWYIDNQAAFADD